MSIKNSHIYNHSSFIKNNNYKFDRDNILKILPKAEIDNAYNVISKWDNYKPTPLLSLNKLSTNLNLKNVFYKDESKRFGLKSFKALGGLMLSKKCLKIKRM